MKNFRKCDFPECPNPGEYKAPKDRSLTSYYWFCLEHVKEYNKNWDYYRGYSSDEIEEAIRHDTIWQRKTKTFGQLLPNKEPFHLPKNVGRALLEMEMAFPYDKKTLRSKYKELAKRFHPDATRGDKEAEEKFKILTQSYKILLDFLTT